MNACNRVYLSIGIVLRHNTNITMDTLVISEATRADRYEIVEYLQEQSLNDKLSFWDNLSTILSDENELFVIKKVGGLVCGYCSCSHPMNMFHEMENCTRMKLRTRNIHYFEIFKDHRNCGYGSALIKWIEEHHKLAAVKLCSTCTSYDWWLTRGYESCDKNHTTVGCGSMAKIMKHHSNHN